MKGCMEVWQSRITILMLQQLLGRYKLKLKVTGGKLGMMGNAFIAPAPSPRLAGGTGSIFNSANWLKGSDPGFYSRLQHRGPGQRGHAGHLFELIEDSDSNSMRLTNMI